jgi:hypothetical protein
MERLLTLICAVQFPLPEEVEEEWEEEIADEEESVSVKICICLQLCVLPMSYSMTVIHSTFDP